MGLASYLLRRVAHLLAVLLLVTLITSLLINLLPGNPAVAILGTSATPKAIAQLNSQLHLNQPFFVRYALWLRGLFEGNFGYSYLSNVSVGHALAVRIPVTLEEVVYSQVIALSISIPLGIWAGYRAGTVVDRAITGGAFFFLAIPSFVLAVLLSLIFAVKLHWLPATGYTSLTQNPVENLKSLLLPSVTLALGSTAIYVRLLRADVSTTLQQNFIEVAKAKGLRVRYILARHALRPSMFTLLAVAALNFAGLIGGAVIVESIFSVPGVGAYLVSSISSRDYLAIQGAVLVVVVGFVIANFAVDVFAVLLDPRAGHARS